MKKDRLYWILISVFAVYVLIFSRFTNNIYNFGMPVLLLLGGLFVLKSRIALEKKLGIFFASIYLFVIINIIFLITLGNETDWATYWILPGILNPPALAIFMLFGFIPFPDHFSFLPIPYATNLFLLPILIFGIVGTYIYFCIPTWIKKFVEKFVK